MYVQFNNWQAIDLAQLEASYISGLDQVLSEFSNFDVSSYDTWTNTRITGYTFSGGTFDLRGSGFNNSYNPKANYLGIAELNSQLVLTGKITYHVNSDSFSGKFHSFSYTSSAPSGLSSLSFSGKIDVNSGAGTYKQLSVVSDGFTTSLGGSIKVNSNDNLSGTVKYFTLSDNAGNYIAVSGAKLSGKGFDNANHINDIFALINKPKYLKGNDTIIGDSQDNSINGYKGKDKLYGQGGNDTINGGKGKDIIAGGDGNDVLIGGKGKDIFIIDTALNDASNVDTIADFAHGKDSIQLSQTIFNALGAGGLSAADFVAGAVATALDATDHILYNTTTGGLYYDADGDGSGAAIQFATLSGAPANLSASDFLIV